MRVNLTVGGVASAGATVTAKHDTTSGTCPTGVRASLASHWALRTAPGRSRPRAVGPLGADHHSHQRCGDDEDGIGLRGQLECRRHGGGVVTGRRIRNWFGRRGRADERGTTLVEVSMTMPSLGIVLAAVYGGVGSLTGAAEGASVRLQNLDEARVMMATITKDIRTATQPSSGSSAFVVAKANELQFTRTSTMRTPRRASCISSSTQTRSWSRSTPATNAAGSVVCSAQPCSYLRPTRRRDSSAGSLLNNAATSCSRTWIPPATSCRRDRRSQRHATAAGPLGAGAPAREQDARVQRRHHHHGEHRRTPERRVPAAGHVRR